MNPLGTLPLLLLQLAAILVITNLCGALCARRAEGAAAELADVGSLAAGDERVMAAAQAGNHGACHSGDQAFDLRYSTRVNFKVIGFATGPL